MKIWEVLSQRHEGDEFVLVGGISAPTLEMALLLARETHFRHGEGVNYAVRARTDNVVHICQDPTGIGGITDRSYRRQEGYVGVGAKLKRVRDEMQRRGLVIDRPRPPARGRQTDA